MLVYIFIIVFRREMRASSPESAYYEYRRAAAYVGNLRPSPLGNAPRAYELMLGSNIRSHRKNGIRRTHREYLFEKLDVAVRRLDENLRLVPGG